MCDLFTMIRPITLFTRKMNVAMPENSMSASKKHEAAYTINCSFTLRKQIVFSVKRNDGFSCREKENLFIQ